MAYTRDDFVSALTTEYTARPSLALLYQAGDPRLLANLQSMATMLAMVSQQVDVESMEAFNKARDSTVLADASMKGILPFGRCPRLALSIKNGGDKVLGVAVGRRLLDQNGKVYVAETAASIPVGQTGAINVKQQTTRTVPHTVTNTVPFYAVQVTPSSDADMLISGLAVSVDGILHPYTPEFANLAPGEPGYALETDEYRRLFVKFGWDGTFGVQPSNGAAVSLVVEETYGENTLAAGASFTFESITQANDQYAAITLESVIFAGANAVDIETLREWAQYPSTYDESAVYLGNFDFLIRRNLSGLRFLSVWNEQVEESVRGPSVSNINKLFVAAAMDDADTNWLQSSIRRIIQQADNSYSVKFVPLVELAIPLTINAQVSVVHDTGDTEAKIRAAALNLYGRDSQAARRGMLQINTKRLSERLKADIPALQDDGADYQILQGAAGAQLPEQYRYVSPESLTVNVTQATYNDGQWSH